MSLGEDFSFPDVYVFKSLLHSHNHHEFILHLLLLKVVSCLLQEDSIDTHHLVSWDACAPCLPRPRLEATMQASRSELLEVGWKEEPQEKQEVTFLWKRKGRERCLGTKWNQRVPGNLFNVFISWNFHISLSRRAIGPKKRSSYPSVKQRVLAEGIKEDCDMGHWEMQGREMWVLGFLPGSVIRLLIALRGSWMEHEEAPWGRTILPGTLWCMLLASG